MNLNDLLVALAAGDKEKADEAFKNVMQQKAEEAVEIAYDHFAESAIDLTEISKATLGSYVKKATRSVATRRAIASDFENDADVTKDPKKKAAKLKAADDLINDARKRMQGIDKATDRLVKEESESAEQSTDDNGAE